MNSRVDDVENICTKPPTNHQIPTEAGHAIDPDQVDSIPSVNVDTRRDVRQWDGDLHRAIPHKPPGHKEIPGIRNQQVGAGRIQLKRQLISLPATRIRSDIKVAS